VPERFNARVESRWRTVIDEATRGVYEESNRRSSALVGGDLSAHGYRT
jgi:hypothetical protein